MTKQALKFNLVLLLTLLSAYFVQVYLTGYLKGTSGFPLMDMAYKFNTGFAMLFGTSIILLSKKLPTQIGFLFLISTVIKAGIFLFVIDRQGLDLNKGNFLDFFVPYALCVSVEIFFISRILNSFNFRKDS